MERITQIPRITFENYLNLQLTSQLRAKTQKSFVARHWIHFRQSGLGQRCELGPAQHHRQFSGFYPELRGDFRSKAPPLRNVAPCPDIKGRQVAESLTFGEAE